MEAANVGNKIISTVYNKKFFMIVILIAAFIALALYVYNTYVAPRLQPTFVPNREFVPEGDEAISSATIYFFSADWCPYSKKAKPIWNEVRTKYEGQKINGIILNFKEVDGDKQEADVTTFEEKYKVKIDGYPTIYMVKGDQVVTYNAKVTAANLSEFITTAL